MKRIPASLIIIGTMATAGTVALVARCVDQRINHFSGVGGRDAFERQRAKHLERLRQNEYVTDPAVRAADAAAIDAEHDEIGKNWNTWELGEELRRIK